MPELAEVQTIASQLDEALPGQRLLEVELTHPTWVKHGEFDQLTGLPVTAARRWGKRLRLEFASGPVAVIGLGMTGAFTLAADPHYEQTHRHLVARLRLERSTLDYTDPRRFGSCLIYPDLPSAERALAGRIGVDARADMPWTRMRDLVARGSGRLAAKTALLDQGRLAGIGSYLADEMLFDAGVHPARPVGKITDFEWKQLNSARVEVIDRALAASGLTFSDYRDTHGRAGDMLSQLRVYGREAQPCVTCGAPVEKLVVGGRSAAFCPACQPAI